MELRYGRSGISLDKELNYLDRFAIDFADILESQDITYAFVSGYVAILFGRSRQSEDIDVFIENLPEERFRKLWENLQEKYESITSPDPGSAYRDYLSTGIALRFAVKGTMIPNVEMKFPKDNAQRHVLEERKKVILNGKELYISPLEGQIAFKLFMGSDKDIEDAHHLYIIFREHLDMQEFHRACRKLQIPKEVLDTL